MACIDMSVDYGPGPELGTIGQEILGRPGATWTKENLQAACARADYAPAESGTLDASGVGTWTFSYGTSDCSNGILGRYVSRMRIMDTDGTTFVLPGSPEVTFHNSTCTPDRATCEAARSFCSL